MPRLPISGSDNGTWGTILNDFLSVEHNPDGTLKASGSLSTKQAANSALTTISSLTPSNDDVMQYKSGAWANRTIAQLRSDLAIAATKTESGWFYSGTIATGTGTFRLYNDSGSTRTLYKVRVAVNTAPTGASIIVDINKGGTTIFTTQANRPTVLSTTNTATGTPDVTTWEDGTYLTADIDHIGSSVAGADMVITVEAA